MRSPDHILVTGATGFLGSQVTAALVHSGYRVTVLVRPTSSLTRLSKLLDQLTVRTTQESLETIFLEGHFDAVLHTAALYGRKGESDAEIFSANLHFPFSLLQKALAHGVKRFINTHTALPAATNVYALSKHQFSDWLTHYASRIQVSELVPEYFYGPGDDEWKFVTMVLSGIANEREEITFTAGDQLRDFIYIDDAVAAFVTVVQQDIKDGMMIRYPLGSGNAVSIRDLVELCGKISANTRTRFSFGAMPARAAEQKMIPCDTKALQDLGWICRTSLQDGLTKTWNVIKQGIENDGRTNGI